MKGWRTILVNLAIVAATAALQYLGGIDWISMVGETWAVFVVAAVNVALRAVTNTPLGKSA